MIYSAGHTSPSLDVLRKSPSLEPAVQPAPVAPSAAASVSQKTPGGVRPPPGTQKQPVESKEQSRGEGGGRENQITKLKTINKAKKMGVVCKFLSLIGQDTGHSRRTRSTAALWLFKCM